MMTFLGILLIMLGYLIFGLVVTFLGASFIRWVDQDLWDEGAQPDVFYYWRHQTEDSGVAGVIIFYVFMCIFIVTKLLLGV